ncbi:MAG: selenocysteine-specific translation elongation factor [Planctomycetota bacterium]
MKLAPTDIANVVIGTAGHVDHGKTSLVEALTGVNADRWEEERERGITIDIGFASRELPDGRRVGFIDVPGHERFVRHMIAGAAGVDVVLLVVAADDGVMPQTREHVEILGLLGARGGVIAVTKSDVDPELAELAAEEVKEFAKGTFLEGAPVVRVSSVTGEGVDELWGELERCVLAADPRPADGLFRMPVQRAFTLQGFGTVLTGVPVSGTAMVGDAVEVLPGGGRGRLRGIQSYFRDVELARAGNSTGLNVSDIDAADCRRGQVVVKRDTFEPATLADVRLVILPSAGRPLENGTVVRFHTGTAEVAARVALLEGEMLSPGADALAQFRLEEGVVFARGDRFIIRLPSPAVAMGGGTIIGPGPRTRTGRARTSRARAAQALRAREAASRADDTFIEHLIETWPESAIRADVLERAALIPEERTRSIVAALVESGNVREFGPGPTYLHARSAARLAERLTEMLAQAHAAEPHLPGIEMTRAGVELRVAPALLELVAGEAVAAGDMVRDGAYVRLASHTPALGREDAALAERVESACRDAPYSPPSVADLAGALGAKEEAVRRAAAFLAHAGKLVETSAGVYFHGESIDRAREFALAELRARRARGVLETQAMKRFMAEHGGTSRKYLVQVLEYFDRIGLTRREGDERRAGERSGL